MNIIGCEAYQSVPTDEGVLYNNVWNFRAAGDFDWSQCIVENLQTGELGWSWRWPKREGYIYGYPQIKRGSSPWDPLPRVDDQFPVKLGDLSSLTVSHELEISTDGQHNVATSFWLIENPARHDRAPKEAIVAEVMVWTYRTPKHMRPGGKRIGTMTHAGQNWSIWLDENWGDPSEQNENQWIYISFVSDKPQLKAGFDLSVLLADPRLSHLGLQDNWIADAELGTEIMSGAGVVWVKHFGADVVLSPK